MKYMQNTVLHVLLEYTVPELIGIAFVECEILLTCFSSEARSVM